MWNFVYKFVCFVLWVVYKLEHVHTLFRLQMFLSVLSCGALLNCSFWILTILFTFVFVFKIGTETQKKYSHVVLERNSLSVVILSCDAVIFISQILHPRICWISIILHNMKICIFTSNSNTVILCLYQSNAMIIIAISVLSFLSTSYTWFMVSHGNVIASVDHKLPIFAFEWSWPDDYISGTQNREQGAETINDDYNSPTHCQWCFCFLNAGCLHILITLLMGIFYMCFL